MAKNEDNNPVRSMPVTRKEGDTTSVPGISAGSRGERNLSSLEGRQATFLRSVAGDCPCERCCGYRDIANTVMNPGTEY